jgi:ferritin
MVTFFTIGFFLCIKNILLFVDVKKEEKMINKKINDTFNQQINEEIYSSYLYLSMAAYFDSLSLTGFSHWFKMQAQEEMFHAMKFYNHIIERDGTVELKALKDPDIKWESPIKAYEAALKHEQHITGCINSLMDQAIEEKDYAARNLLNWFIDEQVEEEASVSEIIEKLKLAGNKGQMLYMLDKELSARPVGTNPYAPAPEEAE